MLPLISIVMPVRNAGPYLRACLDSILEQSYTNWELIAINDNATDDSGEILDEYARNYDRITVLENKGKGIIAALQTAYEKVGGSYITRMDADDIMSVDKLSLLLEALTQKGRGYVATGLVEYFSEDELGEGYKKYAAWLNGLTSKSSNFDEIYKECVIPSPCWMMDVRDFEICGGFNNEVYPEDYDLCFRMYKHEMKVIGVNEVLHHWRDYGERTSRNDEHYADNRFLELKLNYFLKIDYAKNPKISSSHHPNISKSQNLNIPTSQNKNASHSQHLNISKSQNLFVWGAGKKGKLLARLLLQHQVAFTWVSNNKEKIGKDIYGVILSAPEVIHQHSNAQVIVAVAGEEGQREIAQTLKGDRWWFC